MRSAISCVEVCMGSAISYRKCVWEVLFPVRGCIQALLFPVGGVYGECCLISWVDI